MFSFFTSQLGSFLHVTLTTSGRKFKTRTSKTFTNHLLSWTEKGVCHWRYVKIRRNECGLWHVCVSSKPTLTPQTRKDIVWVLKARPERDPITDPLHCATHSVRDSIFQLHLTSSTNYSIQLIERRAYSITWALIVLCEKNTPPGSILQSSHKPEFVIKFNALIGFSSWHLIHLFQYVIETRLLWRMSRHGSVMTSARCFASDVMMTLAMWRVIICDWVERSRLFAQLFAQPFSVNNATSFRQEMMALDSVKADILALSEWNRLVANWMETACWGTWPF